jgi:hypothetical protein
MEAFTWSQFRAGSVPADKRMFPVSEAAPGHSQFLTQRLVIERMTAGNICRFAHREVLEYTSSDDSEATVERGKIVHNSKAAWAMDKLVRV